MGLLNPPGSSRQPLQAARPRLRQAQACQLQLSAGESVCEFASLPLQHMPVSQHLHVAPTDVCSPMDALVLADSCMGFSMGS